MLEIINENLERLNKEYDDLRFIRNDIINIITKKVEKRE